MAAAALPPPRAQIDVCVSDAPPGPQTGAAG